MKPTRERKPRENCSSSRPSSVIDLAERLEGAGVGEDEPVEHLEQRRLAAAVGAEQRHLLAPLDRRARRRRARGSGRGRRSAGRGRRGAGRRPRCRVHQPTERSRPRMATPTSDAADDPHHVQRPDAEGLQRPRVAVVAAGEHRQVHLVRQRVRLAEQRAGRGGDEPPPRAPRRRRGSTVRDVAGGVHVRHRAEEVEQVAVGHAEHEDEHLRHAQRPQRGEEARPRGGEGQEHDQRDRDRDPDDDDRRAVQPLRGEPDLVAEPGAEGHDDRRPA